MRLYEHEAKKLFRTHGIPVPAALGVIETPQALHDLTLTFPLMLKAMVLVGGRGKAGGIKRAVTMAEAEKAAGDLFRLSIKGYPIRQVLLEQCVEARAAAYIGVTMDPATYANVVIVSPAGGVDIEAVALQQPEAIMRRFLTNNEAELPDTLTEELVEFLERSFGVDAQLHASLRHVIQQVYHVYQAFDCKICEINPLLIVGNEAVAADAKIVFDDNARYRHRELFEELGIAGARHDIAESTANEQRAMTAGFKYVDLLSEGAAKDPDKLYVGLVPGGAGYGIFSIDEVANIGRRFFGDRVVPVNFMDSGGGPPQATVAEMFHMLMDYELVDTIITSRFGGISSCDVFIRGLVQCLRERHAKKRRMIPVYGRMVGTDLPSARTYLEKARAETPEPLRHMQIVVGNRMIMADVIREGIKLGFEAKGVTL